MQTIGIDVSAYQQGLDWTKVKAAGAQFGIAKRSEGTGGVDSAFDAHWLGMKAAGLARGAYHFSRWDLGTEPLAEAQWFLGHLPALDVGDVVALDIEASPANLPGRELSAWALTWLVTVERAIGFRPLLYSGYSFAHDYLTDALLSSYGLWVADYGPADCPAPVGPWPLVAMWQRGQASYAEQSVDQNLFFGSLDQLRAYGKPAPAPAPPRPAAASASASASSPPAMAPAAPRAGPRFLITRDMMARTQPDMASVLWVAGKPQMVYCGAVLNGTGAQTPHWVQVVAGGQKVWVWLGNTQPV
jgi:GH25 family lysozyme M1 (1,4-beta-N-acetylmuramidase)